MIITDLDNISRYVLLHRLFPKAAKFLTSFDKITETKGKFEILGDDIFAIITNPGTVLNASAKLELHNKYIDVHYLKTGTELFGWKPAKKCLNPECNFNVDEDYQLFNDNDFETITLNAGDCAILYPEDAHVPCIETKDLLKVILKVKL